MNESHKFHLEINSLEDFAKFIALIKGVDLKELKKEVANLNTSADTLENAVEEASKPA